VTKKSSLELLDETIKSVSSSNSPKNIASDLVRNLLLDTHSYRTRHDDLAGK